MKMKGTVRNMDQLGRVVVPKEYRKSMDLQDRDPMEVFLTDEGILIKKVQNECALCGSKERLLEFENRLICGKCMEKIKKM